MTTPIEREALSSERINQLAREAGLPMSWLDNGVASAWPELERFARAILAASSDDRARIRAEALEEAEKEAVRHTTHPDDPTNEVWQSAYNHVATEIAAAIRALVLPSTGEKT